MNGTTAIVIGAAILGAAFVYERSVVSSTGTPPGMPPTKPVANIPKNIADTMNNAWQTYGRHGSRDQWIQIMLPLLPGVLNYTQWGNVYDQGIGYFDRFGYWANNDVVYGWVVSAAGM